MGWDLDIDDIPRPLSIPLPKSREKGNVQADQPTTAMSSLVLPEYKELDDRCIKRWESTKSKMESPWSGSDNDKWVTKVKVPSTPITAFVQYTTEELDQLDKPHGQRIRGRENLQASAIPPMVYGITPQESLADTDKESKRQGTPIMNQTIIERKSKGWKGFPQLKSINRAIDTIYTEYFGFLSDYC